MELNKAIQWLKGYLEEVKSEDIYYPTNMKDTIVKIYEDVIEYLESNNQFIYDQIVYGIIKSDYDGHSDSEKLNRIMKFLGGLDNVEEHVDKV